MTLSIANKTDSDVNLLFYNSKAEPIPGNVVINPHDEISYTLDEEYKNAGTIKVQIKSSSGEWSGMIPAKIQNSILIAKDQNNSLNVSYGAVEIPGDTSKISGRWKGLLLLLIILVIFGIALFYSHKK